MERFQRIDEGILLGPQPTEQDLQQARQAGVKTVIDFRMPGETPAPNSVLARANGLDYVNIPVSRQSLSTDQIDELDRVMQEHAGPFLIHCASGARAAMLLALRKARKNGWTANRTFDDSRAMGFDVEATPEFAAFVRASTAA